MTNANDNTIAGEAARAIDRIAGTAITDAVDLLKKLSDADLEELRERYAERCSILGLGDEAVDIETVFRRDRSDGGAA